MTEHEQRNLGPLAAQHAIARQLLQADSLDEVASRFLAAIARLLEWPAGSLWEVRADGEALRLVDGWTEQASGEDPWRACRQLALAPGRGLAGQAWTTGEVAWSFDLEADDEPGCVPALDDAGLTAGVAFPVPLGRRERVLAVAEFFTPSLGDPAPELLALLVGFGDQLAMFIERRREEAALRLSEAHMSAIVAAALDCIVTMDAGGRIVEFNPAAERIFGYTRDAVVGRPVADLLVPPELREAHRQGLARYLRTGQGRMLDRRTELRAMRADGSTFPVELTVTRLPGEGEPMFNGYLRDISERHRAEQVQRHMAAIVLHSDDAVYSKDLDAIVTSWNPGAERIYGYTAEQAIGRHISFLVPPDRHREEQRILDRIVAGETIGTYETERLRADGTRIEVSLTVSPIEDPVDGIVGASVIGRDVTARNRRARAHALLSRAGGALDASLDPETTARTIAETAVPELAELCVVDLVREDGMIGDSTVAAVDPEVGRRLQAIRRGTPLDPAGTHPVAQVLRSGRTAVWRDLREPETISQIVQSYEHRELMSAAGYSSAVVVPLRARGRVLGALSFLHVQNDLRYNPEDLSLLEDLGTRAALALDNARLFSERNRVADTLQMGLRPAQPPSVAGLDIAVAYNPAGEGIEVGGDFYEVVAREDGCLVVIGDVTGKGAEAAALSALLRHGALALAGEGLGPADLLDRLNQLLLGHPRYSLATALAALVKPLPGGAAAVLSRAGHPPALLTGAEGSRQVGGRGPLLGWEERSSYVEETVSLSPQELLLLFTDGLLEAGPLETHLSEEALAARVQAAEWGDLDELTGSLCREATTRGGEDQRDDVVVMALRPSGGEQDPRLRSLSPAIRRAS